MKKLRAANRLNIFCPWFSEGLIKYFETLKVRYGINSNSDKCKLVKTSDTEVLKSSLFPTLNASVIFDIDMAKCEENEKIRPFVV